MDLATAPEARVMVFVDGQNLYKRCADLFGHPLCHPHLLAQLLAGPRTAGVRCRFYTGHPSPNDEPEKARNLDRRLAGMRKMGVTVITRPLRYHWDWSAENRLPRPGPTVQPQLAMMRAWRRPQEKGIDLVIGLDVIEFVLTDLCDVAIVVSLDRDLYEIPQAVRNLYKLRGKPYRLEAAVPVSETQKQPKTIPGFAYTHQITRQLFERIRDDTRYSVSDEEWSPPTLPVELKAAGAPSEPTPGVDQQELALPVVKHSADEKHEKRQ